jgi:adenylate cyclase
MAEERVQRRLAAILAADVVGYSRLMEANEEDTRSRLRTLHAELIDPRIASDGGRIVKTTGDGILVEFPSAVDAVRSALAIQSAMAERNAASPNEHRLVFRVGINLGDVIIEGDDIHGDGVNVAARLEGLCKPGEVYLSGSVVDQVSGKINAQFDDLGEQSVKNLLRLVRVYRVSEESLSATNGSVSENVIPLPDKPSIAVLPFENMSGAPDQDYFADGISEDIITALSRIHQFFVVARNTTFTYKGKAIDVQAVAKDLGVRYVLEGSVRRAGNRVRITGQLIDGRTGIHLWAERYDRELEDIFAVQDEITQTVVGALLPELSRAEQERARLKPPENMDAWECYQRGIWHTYRRTRDDLAEAQKLFIRATELDENMSAAYSGLVDTYFFQVVDGLAVDKESTIEKAISAGRRAVDLDSRDALAHSALGRSYTMAKMSAEAIAQLRDAVSLNPNLARAQYALGFALVLGGLPEEGLPHLQAAIRLSPHDPSAGQFMVPISMAYLFLHQHEQALEWARESLRQPNIRWSRWVVLIASLGHLGRLDEASEAIRSMKRSMSHVDLDLIEKGFDFISHTPSLSHLMDGVRKAGMTD